MVLQYLARYFTLAWVDFILFSLSPSLVFSSPPRSFVTSLAFNKQRTLGLWRIFFILNIDKVTTTIGCGSPNKANLYSVHGSALDAKEVDATRKNLGWPWEPFYVPKDVNKHWSRHVPDGAALETEWNAKFADYEMKYEEEAAELKSISTGELPAGWEKALLTYTPENPTDATRNLSQQCLNALTKVLPEFQI